MKGEPVVMVDGLRKRYGNLAAVDGVSFCVKPGEIFGMVGPNGAGKTTTVECIEGLRHPDEGRVTVLGLDPWRDEQALRERMGVQLQAASLPLRLRVGEAIDLFASFYRQPADGNVLLDQLGLGEARKQAVSKLSGGQRQRLFVVLALINRPEVVFLDELTTGLDPQARHATWDLVRQVRDGGCTVVVTTHSMEEAERLCDRVLIIDHGKIVALDTPGALIHSLGTEKRLVFTLPPDQAPVTGLTDLPQVSRAERRNGSLTVYGRGDRFVSSVVNALEDRGVRFLDLHTMQPNLEDVFLALTGREIRE